MSLPLPWIDKIFEKLTIVYGRDFIGRWEGLEISDVKTDWGHELSGFENWPDAISHALATLPPHKPPTVIEFRDIARKAPKRELLELPEPKPEPERLRKELAKLSTLRQSTQTSRTIDHKAWAKRLKGRHEAGELLKPIQLRFASEALGLDVPFIARK